MKFIHSFIHSFIQYSRDTPKWIYNLLLNYKQAQYRISLDNKMQIIIIIIIIRQKTGTQNTVKEIKQYQ